MAFKSGKPLTTYATNTPEHFMHTDGATDSIWSRGDPYSSRPRFPKLTKDIETDVLVIGAGITGISAAYELVKRNHNVVMVEAREVVSGQTDRTSGHLASALDDGYVAIRQKHGEEGAKIARESHKWALQRVGEIAKELGFDCEYRQLDSYQISQYDRSDSKHQDEMKELKEESDYARSIGVECEFKSDLTIPGWTGKIDQRGGIYYTGEATFNPTKYCFGVLAWLNKQNKFKCYTHTRVQDIEEKGGVLGFNNKYAQVSTEDGNKITCNDVVMATCVPLQKLSVIVEMEYNRTYCIAARIPKDSYKDCLIYDNADAYKYIRFTACDDIDDYIVVGGGDHKVGQEGNEADRFDELEKWTRERFTQITTIDYRWSGQVYDPHDYMAFIGLNPGTKHTYIWTGDSGNGLTHAILGAKIIADGIEGKENTWAKLYDPSRVTSLLKAAKEIIVDDLQVNLQFKRWLQTDINDIEDLGKGQGGILNKGLDKPIAVYKTEDGEVRKLSAVCPHLKGMLPSRNNLVYILLIDMTRDIVLE